MIKESAKLILLFIGFFFAAILQSSFFPYFSIAGATPNLIFILFFLVMFFTDKKTHVPGFFAIVSAGFFLDVLSPFYFGTSMLALFIIYAAHHLLSHLLHRGENFLILYFAIAFCGFLLAYDGLLFLFSLIFNIPFFFNMPLVISVAYSLLFAIVGFFIAERLEATRASNNQLKLFWYHQAPFGRGTRWKFMK